MWKLSTTMIMAACALSFCLIVPSSFAQVGVYTAHNDIGRTGQNLNETVLTPSNVNGNQFGKLFSQPTIGPSIAQPLYVPQVAIPGKGTHNVIYVESSNAIYAFDADDNGGIEATPLWQLTLVNAAPPTGTGNIQQGVFGTPVIDPPSSSDPSGTIYLVSTTEPGANFQYLLHALDITTGLEKFGGPIQIQGSVAGTGHGSTGGVLPFTPSTHQQRPGLLLLNGVVYVAFGSWGDIGAWHGWIFSYNATTLQQINAFCVTPNGFGGGFWAGGAALAAEVNDPSKPFGRMFVATGNGTYSATKPFKQSMAYSMSIVNLDLSGGTMTPQDIFTPYNEKLLESQDGDLGSGAPVLLPPQTTSSGTTLNPLVEIGKSGAVYILDRNNLGGYNSSSGATSDNIVQELQTPPVGADNWGAGVWGTESYWNNNIYYPGQISGSANALSSYSFVNGVLSTQPTSQTAWKYWYPSPSTAVSSNGNTAGILWVQHADDKKPDLAMLQAYDATNLQSLLYSSETNLARDNPGPLAKFATPTIVNGKVYVTSATGLSVYGLFANSQTVAPPSISPGGGSFSGSQVVTITDATPGAAIYYTTDGSMPTVNSTPYTQPFSITTSEVVTAIASDSGYLQGAPVSATFYGQGLTANPVFSLAAGAFSGSQPLSITDSSQGAVIYYTVDGSTPTTNSNIYSAPIVVPVSETVQAIAVAPGLLASNTVSAAYSIAIPYQINFNQGFAQAQNGNQMQFNGFTTLDDVRLQLTDGGFFEASSAFYTTPVNIQAFTTDFTFQLSNPVADGFTFTIQNVGPNVRGKHGAGLGYQTIANSVAVKFDLYDNGGEGPNSTGLYTGGALPTLPAVSLNPNLINLHSGDVIAAHLTYDGANLVMTLTDTLTLGTWSYSWPINIPGAVGSNTAYVGFTAGTGGSSSSQKILSWTYLPGPPANPNYPVGFNGVGLALNGPSLSGTSLQLTSGGSFQYHTAYFSTPVNIESFTTNFDFQMPTAISDGFTFVIQNNGPKAIGNTSNGGDLAYGTMPNSAAIKFDIHNNAGEGNDSTGFYVNGALPTLPAINLASTGLVFTNGDSFHVLITYDGTTITWTISDNTNPAVGSVTNSAVVALPSVVDGNTAYVGFTGASGLTGAIQNISDWTFTNP
jgi:hypothetical protein